jgi:hypothetical protein
MTTTEGGEAAELETTNGAHEAPVSSQDKSSERDYEAEAREQGWRPKEEWTGKPDNWKDAKTYVEWGDTNKRLSSIESRIEKEVSERVGKMEKMFSTQAARLQETHKREIASLKAERKEAIKDGNVELVERYDAEIEKREEQAPLTDDPKSKQAEAEKGFATANPWYGQNRKMTAFAKGYSQDLASADPNLSFEDNIKEVLKAVREEFPEYFDKKPAANGHAAVDGGSESPGAAPKNTPLFNKLPPEAKAQCAKDVKAGLYPNNEKWAEVYFA